MTKSLVSDTALLDTLLLADAEGVQVEGGFREVFEQLVEVLGVSAPWAHYRAAQLGRVGRRFEELTQNRFETICPDLPQHTSNWKSGLA